MHLIGADTLFAGREKMRSLEPLVERNFAVLENGPDRDAELLSALVAAATAPCAPSYPQPDEYVRRLDCHSAGTRAPRAKR